MIGVPFQAGAEIFLFSTSLSISGVDQSSYPMKNVSSFLREEVRTG
jgi:hypothetical protein